MAGPEDLPRIHPREAIVRRAELDVEEAVAKTLEGRDLTTAEELRVVVGVFSRLAGSIAKHAIRAERHPNDPDKPGGWA